MREGREHAVIDPLIEEGQIVFALLPHLAEDAFQKILRQVGQSVDFAEGHLRLHHPELGEMTACIRIFRAKSRPEGVDPGKRQGADLRFELTRYREVAGSLEKILLPIDFALGIERRVDRIEGRNPKHITGPLGV